MRFRAGSIATMLVAASIVFGSSVGHAELQRVEAVGIYGIRDKMRSRVIPRDEAISKARWEGVSRVALELIGESAPETESGEILKDAVEALRTALGDDVLPYMRSYRILDDRGEVPALFNDEPDVKVEYVVVVEVIVDVDRVTGALENAGLIASSSSVSGREAVVVELVGLSRYEAFETVLGALREEFGATRIQTLEFSRQRQILAVEGPFGPDALSANLAGYENPQLVLEAAGVNSSGRRIRLIGRWFPEPNTTETP